MPKHTILLAMLAVAPARAAELECGRADPGVVTVDGLLDDWEDVPALERSGVSPRDASFALRCNHDDDRLYVSVEVQDERLIRRDGRDRFAEDRVAIALGGLRLEVVPADSQTGRPHRIRWSRRNPPKDAAVADALTPVGWAVELGLPLHAIPDWAPGVPWLPLSITFEDADVLIERRLQESVSTGEARLTFAYAAALYRQFLRDHQLRPEDIVLDALAEMDRTPGPERVVAAGRVIGILGTEAVFLRLPVKGPKDVRTIRVVDLAGEGKHCILTHTIEHSPTGMREVLAVWKLLSDRSFRRTWAHEVAKQVGTQRLDNTFQLVPKRQGGHDIIIRPGTVTGWDARSWNEIPAEDLTPILLPWGPKQKETWHFSGDESYGGE